MILKGNYAFVTKAGQVISSPEAVLLTSIHLNLEVVTTFSLSALCEKMRPVVARAMPGVVVL
jgi:hypothetical protein